VVLALSSDSKDWSLLIVMRALGLVAALWPGLLSAWMLGCWRALGLATSFAVALNLAIVATLIWPDWSGGAPVGLAGSVAWLLVLGLWVWGIVKLRRDWPRLIAPRIDDPRIDGWFREAQHAYLRGHWSEAETLVRQIGERRPGDVESRLLLASIQRRTKRFAEARQTLDELSSAAAAARWRLEIGAELEQIAEEASEQDTPAAARAA
jgi:hypothetical protein